jgi:predicted methyltransferase
MQMTSTKIVVAAFALLCAAVQPPTVAAVSGPDPALTAAIAGDWRLPEQVARDKYRHPAEALGFWGLKPGMTILEVQPGGAPAWWAEIVAPYARMTGGKYYATAADLGNPSLSDSQRKGRERFATFYAAKPEIYGTVGLLNFGAVSGPLPAKTFDLVLTARSVHGWMGAGITQKVLTDLYASLKVGGILALEQHRTNPGPQDLKAPQGYVTEAYVIDQARLAGFEFVGRSDINANPRDTKDHPFGVWTLPPTRTSVPEGDPRPQDPNFDHSKYDAIGESDRMTLKFRRPR